MRQNKKYKSGEKAGNSLRIIAGRWRGRRIEFADSPGLRPTGDRLRETIFNWLQLSLPGAHCLDLFAGSGAMGFEAASRGAEKVTLIETAPLVVDKLALASDKLDAGQCVDIQPCSAVDFIRQNRQPYDIVFLDPPFDSDLHEQSLNALAQATWLAPACKIIVESPKNFPVKNFFAPQWNILREKTAGQVSVYYLLVE
ncbi:MAG: 16S rRNA (guanine(966)-N(2))-methyltransferase RsmD [Gammaproteobacteria bacterium]|nr:16S rRNA (guanine(966)-N(2))-methyltransferase RsmD [Gammaproteobacteria bacterium]